MTLSLHPITGAFVAATLLHASLAAAQDYPNKPVRVIVPFAPGGGSDITARQVSQKLAERLGQQFIVDNRGGAGGLIGLEMAAKSAPDGYTLVVMSGSFSATPALQKPAFDPINTIIGVVEVGYTPFVLSVHPSLPVKTARELIALARSKPDQLIYASPGVGSLTHLATELMASMAKIKMIAMPYKSTGAAMTDPGGAVPVDRRQPAAHLSTLPDRQAAAARGDHRQALECAARSADSCGNAPRL